MWIFIVAGVFLVIATWVIGYCEHLVMQNRPSFLLTILHLLMWAMNVCAAAYGGWIGWTITEGTNILVNATGAVLGAVVGFVLSFLITINANQKAEEKFQQDMDWEMIHRE